MLQLRTIALLVLLGCGALAFTSPMTVRAHPGGVNADRCHVCRNGCPEYGLEPGEYHCHGGEDASTPAPAAAGASPPEEAAAAPTAAIAPVAVAPPLRLPVVGEDAGGDRLIEGARIAAFVTWGVFGAMLVGAAGRRITRRRSP